MSFGDLILLEDRSFHQLQRLVSYSLKKFI
jgi:hypothetical protein